MPHPPPTSDFDRQLSAEIDWQLYLAECHQLYECLTTGNQAKFLRELRQHITLPLMPSLEWWVRHQQGKFEKRSARWRKLQEEKRRRWGV